jgi:hypothetical protein
MEDFEKQLTQFDTKRYRLKRLFLRKSKKLGKDVDFFEIK